MNGIILIDKAAGITSMSVDVAVRKTLNVKKAGHLGTLDPFATGMLPVFVGDALKILRYCEDYDKCYVCTARFGFATDTLDCDGDIIAENYPDDETLEMLAVNDYKTVRDAFSEMTKITSQMPPKFSAKKIDGKKAYELARSGKDDILEKSLKPHKVRIHSIDILNITRLDKGFDVEFEVKCSKGTYIRTIADDVGRATGFYATAMSLRRTKEGPFDLSLAVTEDKMKEMASQGDFSFIIPSDIALSHIPVLTADDRTADDLSHGRKVPQERFGGQDIETDCPRYRVLYNGKLLAVVCPSEDSGRKFFKCERVFVG
ncbi:MAG: tRNA pseudouridine(55) synthase TruB [Clostridiales bacterium]|nr:tRNA pseudouridine(55) synthase TruB [Clostridiales bacterium]